MRSEKMPFRMEPVNAFVDFLFDILFPLSKRMMLMVSLEVIFTQPSV